MLFAFLTGAYIYRVGIISDLKGMLLQPQTPSPTEMSPGIQANFAFEFLDDPQYTSMNSRPLIDNGNPLKFLVAGHVYGKPGDEEYHPAVTLLNNISLLRDSNPDFFILLGDTVWNPSEKSFNELDLLILDQFAIPIFNAVGNHDVTKRDLYQNRYGNTVYAFRFKNQLFFILDTTLQYYEVTTEQYTFIVETIQEQAVGLEAIHLFMHHVLFLEGDEIIGKQLLKPNEGDGRSQFFWSFVLTTLVPESKSVPIYIYAGDVGAFQGSNLSPLYKQLVDENIFFLATGLGNNLTDSVLFVEDDGGGHLTIQPFSLTGKEMNTIENYSFQYWLDR